VLRIAPQLRGKSEAEIADLCKHGLATIQDGVVIPTIEGGAVLTNSFEGGSDGVTLTQGSGGNTGGASGDYFDTIALGANTTLEFSEVAAFHGAMGVRAKSGSTANNCAFQYDTRLDTFTDDFGYAYVKFNATPSAVYTWLVYRSSGGVLQTSARFTSGDKVRLQNQIDSTFTDSTMTFTVSTYYRFEYHHVTNSAITMRVYDGDSTTLLEEWSHSLTSQADAAQIRWGQLTSIANLPTATDHIDFDSVGTNFSDWPGPIEPPASWTARSGGVVVTV